MSESGYLLPFSPGLDYGRCSPRTARPNSSVPF